MSAQLTLHPVEEEAPGGAKDPYLSGCAELNVGVSYATLRWWLFGQSEHLSRATHQQALDLLQEASASKTPIFFGWMGEGFGYADPEDRCSVTSRALGVFPNQGELRIYSYFKWP